MLKVSYGNIKINKQRLDKSEAINQPTFCFKSKYNTYYSLLMVDPDAPSSEWLHWLVINIKNGSKEELIGYSPPNPPSGEHRYFFILCEQTDKLSLNKISKRANFSSSQFIKDNELKVIDTTFFMVKK